MLTPTDYIVRFSTFSFRFNKNDKSKTASQEEILKLESLLKIRIPDDYKIFLANYGDLWTPSVLDILVDNDIDMPDIQQFWSVDEIIDDKLAGYTKQIAEDMVAFASDCMGNFYSFLSKDIKRQQLGAPIYYFDLEFDKMHLFANSFIDLIESYNKLP